MYLKWGIILLLVLLVPLVSLAYMNPPNKKRLSPYYDVYVEGDWSAKDQEEMIKAVEYTSVALGGKIHKDSYTVFNEIFSGLIIREAPSDVLYFCRAYSNNVLLCKPEKITHRLLIHELGHLFDSKLKGIQGGIYSGIDHPIEFLLHNGILNRSGEFVTGTRYGSYDRNGGKYAPENGYWSDNYRDGWQWHPRGMNGNGNTVKEDWADIFLNWTTNSFVKNENGIALFNWVDNNIGRWIRLLTKENLTYYKGDVIIFRRCYHYDKGKIICHVVKR